MSSMLSPGPPGGIYCGDAIKLLWQVEDESIDLIFTDPVYSETSHYAAVAMHAKRVLKPDSACLVWTTNMGQYDIRKVMDIYLDFVMPLYYTVPAKSAQLHYYNVFTWTTPVLWYQKGRKRPSPWITDTIISKQPRSTVNKHRWNKNVEAYSKWLSAFTSPGDVVLDPFCGGGTVLVVAKQQRREYIGIDIEPANIALVNDRVSGTAPAATIEVNGEQLTLFDVT